MLRLSKIKMAELVHAFKIYLQFCNVKILNSFNPELQPKNTEFFIKNKLGKCLMN